MENVLNRAAILPFCFLTAFSSLSYRILHFGYPTEFGIGLRRPKIFICKSTGRQSGSRDAHRLLQLRVANTLSRQERAVWKIATTRGHDGWRDRSPVELRRVLQHGSLLRLNLG